MTNEELQTKIEELRAEVERLKTPEPSPEKIDRIRTSLLEDDLGFIEVVSTIPTAPPFHHLKRVVLYILGATRRLYVWDSRGNMWHFITFS